jgi:hypothetical protein
MRRLMEKSLQIRAHQVDQIFGQLGRNLLLGAVRQVEADVILKHFAHQSVYPTPHRSQQPELVTAIFIHPQSSLHRIQLAAQFTHSLQQFHSFAFMGRHIRLPRLTIPTPGMV